ncbi:GTP-binding protein [Klebsiella pneumoniae]|uniref:GTP-binding protein n=3 Tax=Gammaproteobacteria TaxID=1236 RepID=UPI0032168DEB
MKISLITRCYVITLISSILSQQHGLWGAVIENEFGEICIDDALVINADEEVFEMNNGCICCTVRGDLIHILSRLMYRRDKFDRILIEYHRDGQSTE